MKFNFRRLIRAPHVTNGTLRNSFDRRTIVVGGIQGGIGCLLAARMTYLSVFENEKYKLKAESNRVNLSLIPPRRGWILDRHGQPLASNRADFRVDVIPERMSDPERRTVKIWSVGPGHFLLRRLRCRYLSPAHHLAINPHCIVGAGAIGKAGMEGEGMFGNAVIAL